MRLPPAYPSLQVLQAYLEANDKATSTIGQNVRIARKIALMLPGPGAVSDPEAVRAAIDAYGANSLLTKAAAEGAWKHYAAAHPGVVASLSRKKAEAALVLPEEAKNLLLSMRASGLGWSQIAAFTWGDISPGARYCAVTLGPGSSWRGEVELFAPLAAWHNNEVKPEWQIFCGPGGAPTTVADLKALLR